MKVKIENYGDQQILGDPTNPDINCLHITRVHIYDRGEDQDKVQVCKYERGGNYEITKTLNINSGNPSDRRDGVVIYFCPEGSSNEISLNISQHKGNMDVFWKKEH